MLRGPASYITALVVCINPSLRVLTHQRSPSSAKFPSAFPPLRCKPSLTGKHHCCVRVGQGARLVGILGLRRLFRPQLVRPLAQVPSRRKVNRT